MLYVLVSILFCLMLAPFVVAKSKGYNKKRAFRSVVTNVVSFCAISLMLAISPFVALAAETASAVAKETPKYGELGSGLGFLSAALVMAVASIGAGIAIAAAGSAAAGATSENPKVFGKVIVFVVLGEGIAIIAFVISFLIVNKL